MFYTLLVCRSLTYAQRTASVLQRIGISAYVLRTPKRISGGSCGYSVKISTSKLTRALQTLENSMLMPKKVFTYELDGTYQEVVV